MSDELGDILDADDRAQLGDTAQLLATQRPLPRPGFRGALRRHMTRMPLPRSVKHARAKAIALAVAGLVLLGAAGAGAAGKGPLAPSQLASAPVSSGSPAR